MALTGSKKGKGVRGVNIDSINQLSKLNLMQEV